MLEVSCQCDQKIDSGLRKMIILLKFSVSIDQNRTSDAKSLVNHGKLTSNLSFFSPSFSLSVIKSQSIQFIRC